jgi:hypothetical protein
MSFDKKGFLESKHTKQLLQMLSNARANWGVYEIWERKGTFDIEIIKITADEIRDVLNTREHVPNKMEGKQKRREMAKRKR